MCSTRKEMKRRHRWAALCAQQAACGQHAVTTAQQASHRG